MIKRILFISVVLSGLTAKAQLATRVDQYYQDFSIINPACINATAKSSVNLFYNRLFTGIKGSPTNILASIVFPNPEKRIGFGLNFAQEKIGFATLYNAYVTYGYTFNINKKSKLLTAASLGVVSSRFNPNAIDVINQDDPYYLSLQQGKADTRFDLKVSAAFQSGGLLFGVSSGRITQPRFTYDYYNYRAQYSLSNLSNAFVSLKVKISKDITLQPLMSANVFDFKTLLLQYGANMYLRDAVWLGLHSSGNKNIALQIGATFKKTIKIGYSYSMPYSSSSVLLGSGHEFYTAIILGKTSELVTDVNRDIVSDKNSTDTTGNYKVDNPNNAEKKENSNPNVISVEKIKVNNDTIMIGSFEDIKFLKSGYDTSKICLKEIAKEYPKDGFYVTVGTFKSEANANRHIKNLYKIGYTAYKFYHPEAKYYYVFILRTDSQDEAEQVKWQEQLEIPDIWVKRVFHKPAKTN